MGRLASQLVSSRGGVAPDPSEAPLREKAAPLSGAPPLAPWVRRGEWGGIVGKTRPSLSGATRTRAALQGLTLTMAMPLPSRLLRLLCPRYPRLRQQLRTQARWFRPRLFSPSVIQQPQQIGRHAAGSFLLSARVRRLTMMRKTTPSRPASLLSDSNILVASPSAARWRSRRLAIHVNNLTGPAACTPASHGPPSQGLCG